MVSWSRFLRGHFPRSPEIISAMVSKARYQPTNLHFTCMKSFVSGFFDVLPFSVRRGLFPILSYQHCGPP